MQTVSHRYKKCIKESKITNNHCVNSEQNSYNCTVLGHGCACNVLLIRPYRDLGCAACIQQLFAK